MSCFDESVKFAQLPVKPKSPAMLEKQAMLIPLIKIVFPDWKSSFIDNPDMDCIEVMMRKEDQLLTIHFNNENFLQSAQCMSAYFLFLLFEAKSRYGLESDSFSVSVHPRISVQIVESQYSLGNKS